MQTSRTQIKYHYQRSPSFGDATNLPVRRLWYCTCIKVQFWSPTYIVYECSFAIVGPSNQIKSIFVYLMLKSTTTVTDAKVVYKKLLGGQCYTSCQRN